MNVIVHTPINSYESISGKQGTIMSTGPPPPPTYTVSQAMVTVDTLFVQLGDNL